MLLKAVQIEIKYFLDRFFALLLMIALSLFFVIISLVIIFDDRGPVFFKQKRPGLITKPFLIWKFRTMVVNADSLLDEKGEVRDLNRITRAGRFLRRMSLDELPQLINILKGEMSMVGPRPALCDSLKYYTEEQKKRFQMKPGVTGWAQVNGRNTIKWSQRIEYDLWYINNYSLWLDLKILLKTVKVVLLREGIVLDRNPDKVFDLPNIQMEAKTRENNITRKI